MFTGGVFYLFLDPLLHVTCLNNGPDNCYITVTKWLEDRTGQGHVTRYARTALHSTVVHHEFDMKKRETGGSLSFFCLRFLLTL